MREAVIHSQRLPITLIYLATGNNFEDLKFVTVTSESNRVIVLETWVLLGRQTASEYCAVLTTDYSVYCATLQYHPWVVSNTVP